MKKHNFGEKEYEKYQGSKVPVTWLPKYKATKEKIIGLLESAEYKDVLNDSDFWIQMNFSKDKTECYYTGLIISHEALIKINDTLGEDDKFREKFCSDPIISTWNEKEILRMEYRDPRDGMFEVGEISLSNCKNDYPFAMLLKRTFDRVVKRKAKLYMVYSDSEAEEFREPLVQEEPRATLEQVERIVKFKDVILDELMNRGINSSADVTKLSIKEASKLCELIEKRMNGNG